MYGLLWIGIQGDQKELGTFMLMVVMLCFLCCNWIAKHFDVSLHYDSLGTRNNVLGLINIKFFSSPVTDSVPLDEKQFSWITSDLCHVVFKIVYFKEVNFWMLHVFLVSQRINRVWLNPIMVTATKCLLSTEALNSIFDSANRRLSKLFYQEVLEPFILFSFLLISPDGDIYIMED